MHACVRNGGFRCFKYLKTPKGLKRGSITTRHGLTASRVKVRESLRVRRCVQAWFQLAQPCFVLQCTCPNSARNKKPPPPPPTTLLKTRSTCRWRVRRRWPAGEPVCGLFSVISNRLNSGFKIFVLLRCWLFYLRWHFHTFQNPRVRALTRA